MRAWTATGDDRTIAVTEVPEPVPAAGRAVVEVAAYSVNRGEYLSLTGAYGEPAAAGTVPGRDVTGTVVAAATDGTGPAVGTTVVAFAPGGAWAERAAVPSDATVSLPQGIPAVVAATLPLAGLTALRLLRRTGPVAGKRLLLTGASGGVGHLVTELAIAAGAEVTANADRGRRLAAFGARVIHDIDTATGSFDILLESVGGAAFAAALARLAPGGTAVWFGQASREPVRLDFFRLFAATPLTVHHFAHWTSDTTDAADLAELVRLVSGGTVHPELGRVADWAETRTVLTDLAHRRIRGNAVLTVTREDDPR